MFDSGLFGFVRAAFHSLTHCTRWLQVDGKVAWCNRGTGVLCVCLLSDKPEVKIMVTYPEGLTREGDNLDLTCIVEGKPQ